MKLKNLIQAPPNETYIKNSSPLVTALLIVAGILYYPTQGYGSIIALAIALIVLVGQKMLLTQTNKDFADMYRSKQQFTKTQNQEYLQFIQLRARQIQTDNKVLSKKGKAELEALLNYVESELGEKKPHYKAIFSDIDGTLLNSEHKITPATEQAIKAVIAKGIPFIPVSARPPYAITPYTNQLDTQQAIICYSGALILDKNLTALYSVILEQDDLLQLNTLLNDFNHLSINYYSGLDWFSNDLNNYWTMQESDITGLTAKPVPDSLTEVHKILVMGEAAEIQTLEQKLKQTLSQLSIHRSKDEYLEIMNKAATKAKAIRFMENHLNINAQDVIAFGDNFNDLDMLQYAGLSIAMGNAPDKIKQAAKEVTSSNDEDGIALVLNRIFSREIG